MTKKDLQNEIYELKSESRGYRYKAEDHDETRKRLAKSEKVLNELRGRRNQEIESLAYQVRELTLRIDILTITSEQIEIMRKVKHRGRLDDPLSLSNHSGDIRG